MAILLLSGGITLLKAQADTAKKPETALSIGGYLDVFYAYDFNKPPDKLVPFMVNHNRHNEFNLNLGSISLNLDNSRYRTALVIQAGTYAIDNYAEEDVVFRFVNEASAGILLTRNGKLWFDAGVIGSHIGWENLFQQFDITTTRSIMVENIPYYFAGAKFTYTFNNKWEVMVMINNGWQHIRRVKESSLPGFGSMLQFRPNGRIQLNWNTFVGTDDPDSSRRMRYFNEIYFLFAFNDKWDIRTGIDYGLQQESKGSGIYQPWLVAGLLTRFSFHTVWALGMRIEYANDKYGIILANPGPNEFNLWGFSANVAYQPLSNVKAQVEGRYCIGSRPMICS